MKSIALRDVAISVIAAWERAAVAVRTVYWRISDWSYRRQFKG